MRSRSTRPGCKWIVRGLVHLILYRFVYLHLAGDPAELANLGDLVQFLLATFLLYLRVSGQFHVIAGVLHLFGFRLPETHHLYFLASSFTDFWRRINIYWKDFMMKLVYYPSFFRLRRFGADLALVAATAIVFLVTWVLHSYQWFWLRGGFPLAPQDAVFWGILGVLVVVGSLRDMKRPRKRRLGPAPAWSASLALRTVCTFSAICLLWSLWSAESLSEWLAMWLVAGNVERGRPVADRGAAGRRPADRGPRVVGARAGSRQAARPAPARGPPVDRRAGRAAAARPHGALRAPGPAARRDRRVVAALDAERARRRAAAQGLLREPGQHEPHEREPLGRPGPEARALGRAHPTPRPSGLSAASWLATCVRARASVFLDQPLTVNRWGMRDRDTSLEKPPGTYRIALLGPSHVMGSGVADGETFADYLEERLNQSAGAASPVRYEVLNFGVAGYSMLEQLAMLEDRVFAFQPDAVFVTDSPRAAGPIVDAASRRRGSSTSRFRIPVWKRCCASRA